MRTGGLTAQVRLDILDLPVQCGALTRFDTDHGHVIDKKFTNRLYGSCASAHFCEMLYAVHTIQLLDKLSVQQLLHSWDDSLSNSLP